MACSRRPWARCLPCERARAATGTAVGERVVNDEQPQGREGRGVHGRRRTPRRTGRSGQRRPRVPGWRSRDVLRAAALVAAVYALVRLIWVAHTILFLVVFGVLFGLALSAGVDRLKAAGVPRALGALSIVTVFIGLLIALGSLLTPALRSQTRDLRTELPAAIDRLESWLRRQQGGVVGAIAGGDTARLRGAQPQTPGASPLPGDSPARTDTVVVQRAPEQRPTPAGEGQVRSLRERLTGELGNMGRYFFPFLS